MKDDNFFEAIPWEFIGLLLGGLVIVGVVVLGIYELGKWIKRKL